MLFIILLACGQSVGSESDQELLDTRVPGEACGEEGSEAYPYGGTVDEDGFCDADDGSGDFASCEEAMIAFGYTPWTVTYDDDGYSEDHSALSFDSSFQFEMSTPWLAVAWSVEQDPGYLISCAEDEVVPVAYMPEVYGEDRELLPDYWVAMFDFNGLDIFDPEEDYIKTLPPEAYVGNEDYVRSGDNIYLLAEE